jgi:transposase
VVNAKGKVLARQQFSNSAEGFRELRSFARQWRPRTWAIEGCNGVGKHLAQRLVAVGERVVDVSTRRAALVRVFAGGNGRKNDDVDAHSIALVGLHTPDLPEVPRGRPQRGRAAVGQKPSCPRARCSWGRSVE